MKTYDSINFGVCLINNNDNYSDFYSISVLSNNLELFISRVINYFNLTGEIEVIISDRIIIAMYVYIPTAFRCILIQSVCTLHIVLYFFYRVDIIWLLLDSMKMFLITYTSVA